MKKQKKGLKGCIRQQSFRNKFDVKQSRIGDTVGKEPAVFLLGENMAYIRAAPSGVFLCYKIRVATERKDEKL